MFFAAPIFFAAVVGVFFVTFLAAGFAFPVLRTVVVRGASACGGPDDFFFPVAAVLLVCAGFPADFAVDLAAFFFIPVESPVKLGNPCRGRKRSSIVAGRQSLSVASGYPVNWNDFNCTFRFWGHM